MSTKKKSLNKQAKEIIRIAEENGVQGNFFFKTTFDRYMTQLGIINELESKMQEDGVLVTKEYVKGRQNLYTNPAVTEFNKTTDSANKTVTTLMKIINNFKMDDGSEAQEDDPLLRAINGDDV